MANPLFSSAEQLLNAATGRTRFTRQACVVPSAFQQQGDDLYKKIDQNGRPRTSRQVYGTGGVYQTIQNLLWKAEGSIKKLTQAWDETEDDDRQEWNFHMWNVIGRKPGDVAESGSARNLGRGRELPSPLDVYAEMQRDMVPLPNHTKLYRIFGSGGYGDMLQKGTTSSNYGFTSTEHKPEYYNNRANLGDYNDARFRAQILMPKGAKVISGNAHENELILPPGTKLSVLDVRKIQERIGNFTDEAVLALDGYDGAVERAPDSWGLKKIRVASEQAIDHGSTGIRWIRSRQQSMLDNLGFKGLDEIADWLNDEDRSSFGSSPVELWSDIDEYLD